MSNIKFMSNIKLVVISTTLLMLGAGQAAAHPLIYAWGGHFDGSHGERAYVINPIAATVLALKGGGGGSGGGGSGGGYGGAGGGSGGGGSGGSGYGGGGGGGYGGGGGSGGSGAGSDGGGEGDGGGPDGPLVWNIPPEDQWKDPHHNNPNPWSPHHVGDDGSATVASVPEPAALGLFVLAFAALGVTFRRRKA